MVAQWAAVGINVEVQTVDLAALMTLAGTTDYDMFAVQYTYVPLDPYPDMGWSRRAPWHTVPPRGTVPEYSICLQSGSYSR